MSPYWPQVDLINVRDRAFHRRGHEADSAPRLTFSWFRRSRSGCYTGCWSSDTIEGASCGSASLRTRVPNGSPSKSRRHTRCGNDHGSTRNPRAARARHRRAAGSLPHRARRPPHRRHEYRGDGGAHRHQAGDGEDTSAPGPHTPKARDGKACRSGHGRCLPVRGPAAASCAGMVTHPREPPRRLHCAATRCTAVPPASSI